MGEAAYGIVLRPRSGRCVSVEIPDTQQQWLRPVDAVVSCLAKTSDAEGFMAALQAPVDSEAQEDKGYQHWRDRRWALACGYYRWSSDGTPLRIQDRSAGSGRLSGIRLRPAESWPESKEPLGDTLRRRHAALALPRREMAQEVLASVLLGTRRLASRDRRAWLDAIDMRLVVYRVTGIAAGWYRWGGEDTLELGAALEERSLRATMQAAMIGQPAALGAALTAVIVLDVCQYQLLQPAERGLREAYVDAGRLAHYMIICATNHKLATHQSPAVRDSALGALLGLDPVDDHILYTVSIS